MPKTSFNHLLLVTEHLRCPPPALHEKSWENLLTYFSDFGQLRGYNISVRSSGNPVLRQMIGKKYRITSMHVFYWGGRFCHHMGCWTHFDENDLFQMCHPKNKKKIQEGIQRMLMIVMEQLARLGLINRFGEYHYALNDQVKSLICQASLPTFQTPIIL